MSEGVQFVIGRPKGKTTTAVQTVLFDGDIFSKAHARAWLKSYGLKYGRFERGAGFMRFRQRPKEDFQMSSFRTIKPGRKNPFSVPGFRYKKISKQKATALAKKFGARLPRVGYIVNLDERISLANRAGQYELQGIGLDAFLKRNPAAWWHDRQESIMGELMRASPESPGIARAYYSGQADAHMVSAMASRSRKYLKAKSLPRNPRRRNPLKHTPGPWEVSVPPKGAVDYHEERLWIHDRAGRIVARTNHVGGIGHQEANAHLIAESPELLDALEALVSDLNVVMPAKLVKHFGASRNKARAAIKRATAEWYQRENPLTKKEVKEIRHVQAQDADRAAEASAKGDEATMNYYDGKYFKAKQIVEDYSAKPRRRKRNWKRNPAAPVEIYDRIVEIKANKGRKSNYAGQGFYHRFTKPARVLGMPDGSLRVVGHKGQRLWGSFSA